MSQIQFFNPSEKEVFDFIQKKHACSAMVIDKHMKDLSRASVYRIIDELKKRKLIKEIVINSQKTYYEVIGEHHHHIVCNECEKILPFALDNSVEKILVRTEKNLEKKNKVNISEHSLTFFGKCNSCK